MSSIVVQRTKQNPVRYAAGDQVYLRPDRHRLDGTVEHLHQFSEPFIVTSCFDRHGFPHYWLVDPDGNEWQAAQLELSSVGFGGFR
jgi:hypothetical protein